MMLGRTSLVTLLVAFPPVFGASCAGPGTPSPEDVGFDSATARVIGLEGTTEITVELACTPDQHGVGLRGRDELADDAGMLFRFDEERPADAGFWMWETDIPLDIAFLDRDGGILEIRTMDPCHAPNPEDCPVHEAGVAHWGALEVNRGWFEEQGITPTARVEVAESC